MGLQQNNRAVLGLWSAATLFMLSIILAFAIAVVGLSKVVFADDSVKVGEESNLQLNYDSTAMAVSVTNTADFSDLSYKPVDDGNTCNQDTYDVDPSLFLTFYTGSSADDFNVSSFSSGQHACVRGEAAADSVVHYKAVAINEADSTDTSSGNSGGSPGAKSDGSYDDPTAGSKKGSTETGDSATDISDTGPQDNVWLGLSFFTGVAISIACLRIWRDARYKSNVR